MAQLADALRPLGTREVAVVAHVHLAEEIDRPQALEAYLLGELRRESLGRVVDEPQLARRRRRHPHLQRRRRLGLCAQGELQPQLGELLLVVLGHAHDLLGQMLAVDFEELVKPLLRRLLVLSQHALRLDGRLGRRHLGVARVPQLHLEQLV